VSESCSTFDDVHTVHFELSGSPAALKNLRWRHASGETAAEEKAVEAPKRGLRAIATVRAPDNGPIALQAFCGMHIDAMNFSGMGHAERAAALVSHRIAAHWRHRLNNAATKWTAFPTSSKCLGATNQRCELRTRLRDLGAAAGRDDRYQNGIAQPA
jgi:hypothetical protein